MDEGAYQGAVMNINEVKYNKKDYLPLLLLADEQENMIDRYLNRGTMYVLQDNGVKAVCVVTDEGSGVLELKNIAVVPKYQRSGYGRRLIDFIIDTYQDLYDCLYVGTGDSSLTVPFYKKCGFVKSHTVKNFFIDNYNAPIYEDGKQLVDMVYLKFALKQKL